MSQVSAILEVQRVSKPKIEDVIPEYLEGDMRAAALDFAEFMCKNKMTLRWAGLANAWKAVYKGKCICYVRLRVGYDFEKESSWIVTPYLSHIDDYSETIFAEGLERTVWDNVFYCLTCRTPCHTRDRTMLGKEFKATCGGRTPIWLRDPDGAAMERVKRLLTLEQQARMKS